MELQPGFSINILIRYWNGTHIQFFIFLVFEDFFKYSLDFDRNNFKDKTGTVLFFTFFMSHKFSCFDKIFSQLSNQRNDWTKQAHKQNDNSVELTLFPHRVWNILAQSMLSHRVQVATKCHSIKYSKRSIFWPLQHCSKHTIKVRMYFSCDLTFSFSIVFFFL